MVRVLGEIERKGEIVWQGKKLKLAIEVNIVAGVFICFKYFEHMHIHLML
jgi:hypothetical protein